MKPWRTLIFPGGTEIGLEIRESLAWCKETTLVSAGAPVSSHAPCVYRHHREVPMVGMPGWLDALRQVVLADEITHIFPAHDDAVLALAENAAALAPAKIVTSPVETCRVARSKSATLDALAKVVPVPARFAADSVPEFPVFLKPDRGQGSQRTALARDARTLADLLAQDADRIVCEYLPGDEYTVDCFSDRERGVLYAAPRERRRQRAGIAMDSAPVHLPELADWAPRIAAALPLHGAWFYQARRDRHGLLRLLEIAPRIGGTSGLSRARGVNLPLLALFEAERIPITIASSDLVVRVDRALRSRYCHDLTYSTLYLDYDDTLVVHGRVHGDLVKLVHQSIERGVRIVLLSRHAGDLAEELARRRLTGLFDEVVHLRGGESKADHISDRAGLFIDDSFAERRDVRSRTGIPVLAPSMVETLLDDRI